MFKKTLFICLVTYFVIAGVYIYWVDKTNLTYRNYAKEKESSLAQQQTNNNKTEYAKGELIVKFKTDIIDSDTNNDLDQYIKTNKLNVVNKNNLSFNNDDPQVNGLLSYHQDNIPVYKTSKSKRPEKYVRIKQIVYDTSAINTDSSDGLNLANYLNSKKAQSLELFFDKSQVSEKLQNLYLIKFPANTNLELIISNLTKLPIVDYAEPNYKVELAWKPNDPYYQDEYYPGIKPEDRPDPSWNPPFDYQWNLKKIQMDKAWDILNSTPNLTEIKVAVIDDGVTYAHPEFGSCTLEQVNNNQCQKIAPGYNFVDNNNDPGPGYHGTMVAGHINPITNNQFGVASINDKIRIIPLKVDLSYQSQITQALQVANYLNAKVINASWGTKMSQTLSNIISVNYESGIVFTVCAHNNGSNLGQLEKDWGGGLLQNHVCKNDDGVKKDCIVIVGATNILDEKVNYSNYGTSLDIMAPSGGDYSNCEIDISEKNIYLCQCKYCNNLISFEKNYVFPELNLGQDFSRSWGGTSSATPQVTALAATILSINPNLTPDEVKYIIEQSADDLGEPGKDIYFGWGRINAYKALLMTKSFKGIPPSPTPKPKPTIDLTNCRRDCTCDNPAVCLKYPSCQGAGGKCVIENKKQGYCCYD